MRIKYNEYEVDLAQGRQAAYHADELEPQSLVNRYDSNGLRVVAAAALGTRVRHLVVG